MKGLESIRGQVNNLWIMDLPLLEEFSALGKIEYIIDALHLAALPKLKTLRPFGIRPKLKNSAGNSITRNGLHLSLRQLDLLEDLEGLNQINSITTLDFSQLPRLTSVSMDSLDCYGLRMLSLIELPKLESLGIIRFQLKIVMVFLPKFYTIIRLQFKNHQISI